jgi:outer membrane immunogenic protein
MSGGLIGGTGGYNWQSGNVVYGLEGDIAWANIHGSTFANCPLGCNEKQDAFGTLRARLGFTPYMGMLVYVTGGAAYEHVSSSSGTVSGTDSKWGWTGGGGVEARITNAWSWKAEYLYADFGSTNAYQVPAQVVNNYVRENIFRVGLNYKIGN